MKTDGRLPKLSTASTTAFANRPRRGYRKLTTAALATVGSLACLLAVAYGQERAPSPSPITPPPRGLAPADTAWTAPSAPMAPSAPPSMAIPGPQSAPQPAPTKQQVKLRSIENGTASDLPDIAPKNKSAIPTPKTAAQPMPKTAQPVSRDIIRASYQDSVPLQNVPLEAIPQQPIPPQMPPNLTQQATQLPSYGVPSAPDARTVVPGWTPVAPSYSPSHSSAPMFRAQSANDFVAQVQAQGEPPVGPTRVPGKIPEMMPQPRPAGPFGPEQIRIQRLPDSDTPLGRPPVPTAKDIAEYNAFVGYMVDPHLTLDLVKDRVRIMQLKARPLRTQIGDANIVEYNFIGQKALDIAFIGKQVGTTVFNVWFEDPNDRAKEKILSFLVNVIPDPMEKTRLENVYRQLEKEINCQFPNSVVCLKLVGDKVVVSGQAFDVPEATRILQLVAANSPSYQQNQTRRAQNREKQDPSRIPLPLVGTATVPGLDDYIVSPDANIINQLRIGGEQQVMLRVTVAEVQRNAARSIGVNFSVAGNTTGTNLTGGLIGAGAVNTPGIPTGQANIQLVSGSWAVAINALRNMGYARNLAEPNLVALNGQTASFQVGGQFPVPVVAGNTFAGAPGVGGVGVSFVPFGVQLNFTPFVTDKDAIRLNMATSVSVPVGTGNGSGSNGAGGGASIAGTNVPGLTTRNFQTTVELREGQTLAVAGLIQNNLLTNSQRIPLFGDIPILANLTGFSQTNMTEQELIVLVTPELQHSMDHKQQPPLPGADLFEPSDLEFYVLGRLEGRRGRDYRSPVMTDIDRMIRFRRCEEQYIFGPTGFDPQHP